MNKRSFGLLRNAYKIPACYGEGMLMPNGNVDFDYCDSTITVHADGSATETHLGFSGESHAFVESKWDVQKPLM